MFQTDSHRTGYMQHLTRRAVCPPLRIMKTALTIKQFKKGLPPKQIDKKWAAEMTCFTEAHKSINSHYFCSDENKSKTSALSNLCHFVNEGSKKT